MKYETDILNCSTNTDSRLQSNRNIYRKANLAQEFEVTEKTHVTHQRDL